MRRATTAALIPLFALLLAAVPAIAAAPQGVAQHRAAAAKVKATEPETVAEKCQRWTVQVWVDGKFHGSGVCNEERIVTAAHLFEEPYSKVEVVTFHGCKLPVTMTAVCYKRDLAALSLPKGVRVEGPKWTAAAPKVGARILAVGSPASLHGTVSAGMVSYVGRQTQLWGEVDQTDATIYFGSSGGGIYEERSGDLVGIIVGLRAQQATLNFFVPVRTLRGFYEANQLTPG